MGGGGGRVEDAELVYGEARVVLFGDEKVGAPAAAKSAEQEPTRAMTSVH